MRIPIVDIGQCNMCMSCVEVCPEVFKENTFGYIEISDKFIFFQKKIEEAIMYCPQNCISWH